jgi:DNA-binding transcriptional regulator/RsmH inhibitor MraZ
MIPTFHAIPRQCPDARIEHGYAIKQDGNGRWGVCLAHRERDKPRHQAITLGKFLNTRRWAGARYAERQAEKEAGR